MFVLVIIIQHESTIFVFTNHPSRSTVYYFVFFTIFFFEIKGKSAARSYKKENASSYKGCDYKNNKKTQTFTNSNSSVFFTIHLAFVAIHPHDRLSLVVDGGLPVSLPHNFALPRPYLNLLPPIMHPSSQRCPPRCFPTICLISATSFFFQPDIPNNIYKLETLTVLLLVANLH